ncbi:MAG: RNA polymerase sigma-54 factor [Desulfobacteraceae bacterium 4484_190.2]|nr:MAG: RNA polymerase sigma-54 factor [Desulfobacteraceae bacterium 4484_190.2]
MALELRQSLILSQQLIMTPQLQQAIKLLQLSRLELLDTISQEMEENPVLEEQAVSPAEDDTKTEVGKDESGGDVPELPEVTIEEHVRDDVDWESYLSEYNNSWAETSYEPRDTPSFESTTSSKTNLYSHLIWQLNMSNLNVGQREIGVYIIGNINEDGYLDIPLEEISRVTGYPMEEVLGTLAIIQNFDPVGVAARDTRECLLIQIKFQNLGGTLVEKIITDHLGDLENRKYDQIAKNLSVPITDVLAAMTILQGLEPKPGRIYSDEETIYITPDIYVFKVGDVYEIVQNEDGLPKLRINAYYKDVLRGGDSLSDNAKIYIQEKLRSAAWLIKSIHQRQRTIYRVTESIVRFQRGFLDNGIAYLRPLVLRDVAENIDMHESTVSRVTTNKYVHTPQGIFELKFFFNSSIRSVEGDAVASESVKEQIRKIVKMEKATKPYSDQDISDILVKLNIRVARRTVAKYREMMGILPSRKRKNLY